MNNTNTFEAWEYADDPLFLDYYCDVCDGEWYYHECRDGRCPDPDCDGIVSR